MSKGLKVHHKGMVLAPTLGGGNKKEKKNFRK
jgi:hypothetical protein